MQGKHIQESSAFFFKNGGKPSGVITIPGSVDADKATEIKKKHGMQVTQGKMQERLDCYQVAQNTKRSPCLR